MLPRRLPLVTLAGLAACNGAKAPEPFPQAAADGWLGSFNGGDVAGLVLMYSEDAKILPPDEPVITGPRSDRGILAGRYNAGPGAHRGGRRWTSERLGEFWFREGAYTAISSRDEGEPRVGKFIELWKKENGNWLLYRQMWNRNAPLPASAPDGRCRPPMSLRDNVEAIFPEWERWYPSLFDAAADLGVIRAPRVPAVAAAAFAPAFRDPQRGDRRVPRALERGRAGGLRLAPVSTADCPVTTAISRSVTRSRPSS